jgi:hypothetical protein
VTEPPNQTGGRSATGEAQARVRAAVRRIVERERGQLGLLLDGSGAVTAAWGNPAAVDPVTFASLATAHALCAQTLAPLTTGAEFSEFVQEGARSAVVLTPVGPGGVLALLFAREGQDRSGNRMGRPDMVELGEALASLHAQVGEASGGRVGGAWVEAAEDRIDRIFREGR